MHSYTCIYACVIILKFSSLWLVNSHGVHLEKQDRHLKDPHLRVVTINVWNKLKQQNQEAKNMLDFCQ